MYTHFLKGNMSSFFLKENMPNFVDSIVPTDG